jgi:hypothetical protein
LHFICETAGTAPHVAAHLGDVAKAFSVRFLDL